MKRIKRLFTVLAAMLIVFAQFAACNKNDGTGYEGNTLHFQSSDAELADFLNDFSHRHLRYDNYGIAVDGEYLNNTAMFAMNWSTMGSIWHNFTGNALNYDMHEYVKYFIQSISQDDLGMIYSSHNNFMVGMSQIGEGISQGWPFPIWTQSGNKSTAFEFNSGEQDEKLWTASDGAEFSVNDKGYAVFSFKGNSSEDSFRLTTSNILSGNGIYTEHAPIVEMELCFDDSNNYIGSGTDVAEIYLIWKTKQGGDQWFKAPYSLYCTNPKELNYSFAQRLYMSMYLHEDWDKKIVTDLGIEIKPKEGKTLNITNGSLNYIRPNYDTRKSNFTYQYILMCGNYFNATNDNAFLEEVMPKIREAYLFLTHALQGEKGLLNIDYLYGHNAIGRVYDESGNLLQDNAGNGITNSYWDIMICPEINLEANVYFYEATLVMQALEKRAEALGLQTEPASVKNRLPGEQRINYNYNSSSLGALASMIKTKIEADIKPVLQPNGRYQNEGGFWNPETGRFASGIREDLGTVLDYGYTIWNSEAVMAGIGSAGQQASILDWLTGARVVEGDTSCGEDIYFYEFAPRTTTKSNVYDFGFLNTTYGWSKDVQDGGVVLWASYYDLMARIKAKGADSAYERLKGINEWYKKVQNAGGAGTDFYFDYYLLNGDGTAKYTLQQSGVSRGAIGLDREFLENCILPAAVPYGFFGMDGSELNAISFTNNLPSALKYLQIDNMLTGGVRYSVRMEKNVLEVKNIVNDSVPEEYTLKFRLDKPSDKFTVKINGKETADYKISGDKIVVAVPFGNVRVEVK